MICSLSWQMACMACSLSWHNKWHAMHAQYPSCMQLVTPPHHTRCTFAMCKWHAWNEDRTPSPYHYMTTITKSPPASYLRMRSRTLSTCLPKRPAHALPHVAPMPPTCPPTCSPSHTPSIRFPYSSPLIENRPYRPFMAPPSKERRMKTTSFPHTPRPLHQCPWPLHQSTKSLAFASMSMAFASVENTYLTMQATSR